MAASFGRAVSNLCEQVGDRDSQRVGQGAELPQPDVFAGRLRRWRSTAG